MTSSTVIPACSKRVSIILFPGILLYAGIASHAAAGSQRQTLNMLFPVYPFGACSERPACRSPGTGWGSTFPIHGTWIPVLRPAWQIHVIANSWRKSGMWQSSSDSPRDILPWDPPIRGDCLPAAGRLLPQLRDRTDKKRKTSRRFQTFGRFWTFRLRWTCIRLILKRSTKGRTYANQSNCLGYRNGAGTAAH